MKQALISLQEKNRLEVLRSLQILDTPGEERFDRLVRMARNIFDVPIAIVSLVDENRQWFKSCIGLDVQETERNISFCTHAILDDKVFIIEDSLLDERFKNNPLVLQEPKMRFYAGCPLKILNHRIGTLCLIDTKPRKLSDTKIGLLKDLASMVEHELIAVQIATIDELTEIPNRRGFKILAEKGISISKRQRVVSCLAAIDLDEFKKINDTLGHQMGDKVLKDFAEILKKSIRDADIVGRLSGDEFAIWYSDTNKESAKRILNRLKELVEKYNETAENYQLKFSVGLVEIVPEDEVELTDLLNTADLLMYRDKYNLV